ncbi:DUF2917 domain-containing protein [Pelomonas sp. KK5]|uniref:DUF2917 domain-containing protein n=1 Tax=Pelomonas sp. KK5 TaxID=1855730 RepID=UPI00097BC2B1|nr:DUF2917 domain-containing protein [Pelomonas sp. KK5]
MNTASIDAQELALPRRGPVQHLDCEAGAAAELLVLEGRVWLTREGWLDDHFLAAGERWTVAGPARLHVSADGGDAALLALRRRSG